MADRPELRWTGPRVRMNFRSPLWYWLMCTVGNGLSHNTIVVRHPPSSPLREDGMSSCRCEYTRFQRGSSFGAAVVVGAAATVVSGSAPADGIEGTTVIEGGSGLSSFAISITTGTRTPATASSVPITHSGLRYQGLPDRPSVARRRSPVSGRSSSGPAVRSCRVVTGSPYSTQSSSLRTIARKRFSISEPTGFAGRCDRWPGARRLSGRARRIVWGSYPARGGVSALFGIRCIDGAKGKRLAAVQAKAIAELLVRLRAHGDVGGVVGVSCAPRTRTCDTTCATGK